MAVIKKRLRSGAGEEASHVLGTRSRRINSLWLGKVRLLCDLDILFPGRDPLRRDQSLDGALRKSVRLHSASLTGFPALLQTYRPLAREGVRWSENCLIPPITEPTVCVPLFSLAGRPTSSNVPRCRRNSPVKSSRPISTSSDRSKLFFLSLQSRNEVCFSAGAFRFFPTAADSEFAA